MQHVYAYIRVSTVKQGTQGVSLQEQRAAIERYAKTNNLSIIEWFEEQETAAKQGRAVFNTMLGLLRAGKGQGVIIHKIDRSARNLRDWADLGELIDSGITVHFANESLDMHTRGGRLSADIQAVIAADYIRNLREETRKGFYGRLKQGLYPLPAPIGYLDHGRGKPKTIDPAMGPLVTKTFELYALGQYSLDDLVDTMYRMGLRNRRGGKVTRNGVSRILNNPFYMGIIRLRKTGELFEGIHKALVSKQLYDRVQYRLRLKSNYKILKHNHLLRKLFSCATCDRSLIGEIQKGHTYYRCHTPTCKGVSVRENVLEQKIGSVLQNIRLSRKEIHVLQELTKEIRSSWAEKKQTTLSTLRLSLGSYDDKLHRLTDAYLDQAIDKDIFEHRKNDLVLKRKEIQEQIDNLKSDSVTVPDQIEIFLEQAKSLYSTYDSGYTEEKRDVLESTTSNRTVCGKTPYVSIQKPFLYVSEYRISHYGDPCRYSDRTLREDTNYLRDLFDELVNHFKISYQ